MTAGAKLPCPNQNIATIAHNMITPSSGPSIQPSQSGIDVFRHAVKYILTEWPSLSLACENGMGGAEAEEKRDWMCKTVIEAMLKDPDVDLFDYIGEILNVEFDTVIEDGSLEYNIQWINKFYKDCRQGKEQEVLESINKAAQKKLSLGNVRVPPPVCQTNETSDEDDYNDEDEEENEAMS